VRCCRVEKGLEGMTKERGGKGDKGIKCLGMVFTYSARDARLWHQASGTNHGGSQTSKSQPTAVLCGSLFRVRLIIRLEASIMTTDTAEFTTYLGRFYVALGHKDTAI